MGAKLSLFTPLTNAEPSDLDWEQIATPDTFLALSDPAVLNGPELTQVASAICKQAGDTPSLWIVVNKLIESLEARNFALAASLLAMVRLFCGYVFSERIPYDFLFREMHDTPEETKESESHAFQKIVSLVAHIDGVTKTVQVHIPESIDCDLRTEEARMKHEIRSQLEELKTHLGPIDLMDGGKHPVTLDKILTHFSGDHGSEDLTIKDPFAQPKPKGAQPYEIYIHKAQFIVNAQITRLLVGILDCISTFIKPDVPEGSEATGPSTDVLHLITTSECVNLLIVFLSTQLYYQKPCPEEETGYDTFRTSPILDVLAKVAPARATEFLAMVIDMFIRFKNTPTSSPGRISRTFRFFLPSSQTYDSLGTTVKQQLAHSSIVLATLLINYYRARDNPFRFALSGMYQDLFQPFYQTGVSEFSNGPLLALFYSFLTSNPKFMNFVASVSDPEIFIEPIWTIYFNLIILFMCSQDVVFSRVINMDQMIASVTWVHEYKLTDISVGSLVLLSLISLFRDNLVHVRDSYVHTICLLCLYNLSEHSFNLHNIASLQLLKLIKAVYSKYQKLEEPAEKNETIQVFNCLLEILTRMMRATVSNNATLTYVIMHHSTLFEKIAQDENVSQENVALFQELIDYLQKSIDSEDIFKSVATQVKMFAPKKMPEFQIFKKVLGYNYKEDEVGIEAVIIPYIWRNSGMNGLLRGIETSSLI